MSYVDTTETWVGQMLLSLDIETLPQERVMHESQWGYPSIQVPETVKRARARLQGHPLPDSLPDDVAAVEEWDTWARRASTTPALGRVLALGMHARHQDGRESQVVSYAEREADEADLLADWWRALGRCRRPLVLVTWNGSFDLHFLIMRSVALGVASSQPARRLRGWFRRYVFDDEHFDCRAACTNWAYGSKDTLDEWLSALGLSTKSMHGSHVLEAFAEGQHDEIRTYVQGDATANLALYDRLAPFFL